MSNMDIVHSTSSATAAILETLGVVIKMQELECETELILHAGRNGSGSET